MSLRPEHEGIQVPLAEYLEEAKVDVEKIKQIITDAQEAIKALEQKIKELIEKYL